MDIWPLSTPYAQKNNLTDIEIKRFQTDWDQLHNIADFYDLLKGYALDELRVQAFELAGKSRAYRLQQNSIEELLTVVAQEGIATKIIVGNSACVQIYSGKIQHLVRHGQWFNVLDPSFNLHLDTTQIAQVWLIQRPSKYGQITAIEAFDAQEKSMLMMFGMMDYTQVESDAWREVVMALRPIV
jgi:putative hemin transport protein